MQFLEYTLLNLLIAILGILITIFIIVGIHEFGHFIVARMLGIKVLRFSIGFGKKLFSWQDKAGTEYVLAAVPLGGYVKMLDETEGPVPAAEVHLAFNRQPLYKKIAVVIAGPLTNFILAIFLYWIIFIVGFKTIAPIIDKIAPHSIAATAGLKSQEEILKIDHHPTVSWTAVMMRLLVYVGDSKTVLVETKTVATAVQNQYVLDLTGWRLDPLKPDPLGSLGITPYLNKSTLRHIQFGPIDALSHAVQNTINLTELNFLLLGKMIAGKISLKSLGGPITIFESAGTALTVGILPFISFLAFLSIAIGAINVVPVPGLDGGHLLIYLIEVIIRKPLSQNVQVLLYRIGLIILLLLITQAIANDIARL